MGREVCMARYRIICMGSRNFLQPEGGIQFFVVEILQFLWIHSIEAGIQVMRISQKLKSGYGHTWMMSSRWHYSRAWNSRWHSASLIGWDIAFYRRCENCRHSYYQPGDSGYFKKHWTHCRMGEKMQEEIQPLIEMAVKGVSLPKSLETSVSLLTPSRTMTRCGMWEKR